MSLHSNSEIPMPTVQTVISQNFHQKPGMLAVAFQRIVAAVRGSELTLELSMIATHLSEYEAVCENNSVAIEHKPL